MNCPNCSAAHADDAAECPKCGIVLAKWRAAQASGVKSTFRSQEGESSPLVLWGGLGVAVLAYWFFFRTPAAPSLPAGPAPSAEQTASPPSAQEWKFTGLVLDLKSLVPVAGAQVVLAASAQPDLPVAAGVTEEDGRYAIKVPDSVKGGAYTARITHPKIQGGHFKGSADDFPEDRRATMRCPKNPSDDALRGQGGSTVTQDFLVCLK